MVEQIDTWIGKTLFAPLIIRICQQLHCTQYRFHRVCWFTAALVAFGFSHASFGVKVLQGAIAVAFCLLASLVSDHLPTRPSRWVRLFVIGLLGYDVLHPNHLIAFDLLVLFAEYASTIRTIPPLEAKEPLTLQSSSAEGLN